MCSAVPHIYSIDTSSLMDWQDRYYPTDVFPGITTLFDNLIAQQRLVMAEMVKEEILAMGSEGLCQWAQDNKGICLSTAELLPSALTIISQYPGLSDPIKG